MKLGNFQDLLDERFTKEELAEIDREVELELAALKALQQSVKELFENYMKQNNLGFNDLVKKLDSTPKQVSRIQKGQANLTLASLAMLSAKLGQKPVISFKKK